MIDKGEPESDPALIPDIGRPTEMVHLPTSVGEPTVDRAPVGRNIRQMLTSQALTWMLGSLLVFFQPRFLGPEGQGRLRLAFSLWTMSTMLVGLGTSTYLQLEVAKRGTAALRLIAPILALRLTAMVITATGLGIFTVMSSANREFQLVMLLFGLSATFASCAEVFSSTFVGFERLAFPARVNVESKLLLTVGTLGVLFVFGNAVSVTAVAALASLLSMVLLYRRLNRLMTIPRHVDVSSSGVILRGSFTFLAAGAILVFYQQIDTVVIAAFVDERALGWYSAADGLFGTLLFLPVIVGGSIFPTLGRLYEEDKARFEDLVRRTLVALLIVGVPIGFGTLVIAPTVAPLVFGEDFREAGPVLAVFGVVLVMTTVTVLLGTVAMSIGRQTFWNGVMIAMILLTIPLDIVLIPWTDATYDNGAIGGAIAYVVTEGIMLTVGIALITPFVVDRATMSRVLRLLACGVVMIVAAWPLRHGFLGLTITVGAVVYLGGLLLLRVLGGDEKQLLLATTKRLGITRRRRVE